MPESLAYSDSSWNGGFSLNTVRLGFLTTGKLPGPHKSNKPKDGRSQKERPGNIVSNQEKHRRQSNESAQRNESGSAINRSVANLGVSLLVGAFRRSDSFSFIDLHEPLTRVGYQAVVFFKISRMRKCSRPLKALEKIYEFSLGNDSCSDSSW